GDPLPRPLHPPRRHLQSATRLDGRARRHLSHQKRQVRHHLADRSARSLCRARAAAPLRQDPPLRTPCRKPRHYETRTRAAKTRSRGADATAPRRCARPAGAAPASDGNRRTPLPRVPCARPRAHRATRARGALPRAAEARVTRRFAPRTPSRWLGGRDKAAVHPLPAIRALHLSATCSAPPPWPPRDESTTAGAVVVTAPGPCRRFLERQLPHTGG